MGGSRVVAAVALAAVTLSACVNPAASRDVVDGAPVTLRLGTPDGPGRPGAEQVEEFARQAAQFSDGQIRIEPVWHAAGESNVNDYRENAVKDWDQVVARKVVHGELDLGMIPARAWDTEGVDSLRALHAPMLVTSDALVEQVVTGELGEEMLAGLDAIGVTGLALLPEGLRHLFAFGDPPSSPADLDGWKVRSPRSETSYALFEALSAQPTDFDNDDDALVAAIETGNVAAESSYPLAATDKLVAATTAIGNVTLFPKVNTLVVNTRVLDSLPAAHQAALHDAARATLAWAVENTADDVTLAARYCADGGRIVHVEDEAVTPLAQAVQPVYEELERDPATEDLIARIRTLAAALPPAEIPAPCDGRPDPGAEVAAAPGEGGDDPGVLNGIYRYEVPYDHLRAHGIDDEMARQEEGVHTVTMRDGEFIDAWSNELLTKECPGVYTVDGRRVTLRFTPPHCSFDWAMTYTLDGDQILWSELETLPPFTTPLDERLLEAFNTVPWTRIGDVEN